MASQMWFGNENRFQWVPVPSTGMQVSNVGYHDSLGYQSGRKGIVRSMQTHKEYEVDFPVQEASGLTGLDVFNRYASGYYGDCDSYPIFFADPFAYDQNLFPMGWSAPGLYARGWSSIGPWVARSYLNLATNPSVEVDATNYQATAGTGGTASGARQTSGPLASGMYSYRVTWTVATSSVSGGADYLNIPVNEGTMYDFRTHVVSSKTQRVLMTVRWRNAADASISTMPGTQTVLGAVALTQLSVPGIIAPAGAVTADIEVRAVTGTSGVNWANGDWLAIDGVWAGQSNRVPPIFYFDGDTPGAGWIGTRHNSTSFMYVGRENPTVTDTPANSFQLPQKQATFNITSPVNAVPTVNNQYGEIPYAIIPVPPGYTLHMGATGSATGSARVVVEEYKPSVTPLVPVTTTALTLLSSTGSTRLNTVFSSMTCEYVKVYLQRTTDVTSTITISSMVAQLWPTGYSPTLTGNFIEGKGHRGLKFDDDANVESYQIVDRNRNIPIHYTGMSTRLSEAQDKG